ncbi:MAG: hypothetical protein OQK04_18665 [Kangiellaceae bacterium]|nr:hypothetical protein [Kangiellaceae bacterium]MCW9000741.1 hypothetical protein [Kangiellaceae bacterium]
MKHIKACPNPQNSLIEQYELPGSYTDCFTTTLDLEVSHQQFVEAFYTSWLFKLERWFLTFTVLKPSSDEQARELALGQINKFSAWRVENRAEDQILMCDFQGKTRSFLMVESPKLKDSTNGKVKTYLYFGTAIVPTAKSRAGKPQLSLFFKGLLLIHRTYAKALLKAARDRLIRLN